MEDLMIEFNIYFNEFKDRLMKLINTYKKPFLILFSIYVIAMTAIFRANFNYKDDIGRIAWGSKGWDDFSRYINCFLSSFIHADSYLTDVSPLPQLLAIVLLTLSSIILLKILLEKKKFSLWELIAVIPLGLSPYFLECLSFKYDSPYMALSIFVSIVPLLFYKKSLFKYLIIIIICILMMCMSYQASSGIFPMIVILISLKRYINKENFKSILSFIFISIVGYILGLFIFKYFFMHDVDTYVSNSIPELSELFPTIIGNLGIYFNYIINDFKIEWLIFIGILCLGYMCAVIYNSKCNKSISFILALFSVGLMLVLSFGMYSVLEVPLFLPRTMYGFGLFIVLLGVYIVSSRKLYITKLFYFVLCWSFFVFSFTYGNALYIQNEYTNFRLESVLNDLKDMDIFMDDFYNRTQIKGSVGYAPVLRNMPQDYDMLNRLIPISFQNSNYILGRIEFLEYYNLNMLIWEENVDLSDFNLPILKDTMYHTIRGNERYLLVILK